jgi:hypothetical protein
MRMPPRLRKFALTAHVLCSVGWLGAVVCFLALAIAGLIGEDPQKIRADYLAMELTASWVIVPLSLASLLTGVVQSLASKWGLFRHYWVLIKLLMNVFGSILLLVHMRPIRLMAAMAEQATLFDSDVHDVRIKLMATAGAAVIVLLVATTLSVYKPRGRTRYGWQMLARE